MASRETPLLDIFFPTAYMAVVVRLGEAVWVSRDGEVLGQAKWHQPYWFWIRIQAGDKEMGAVVNGAGFHLLREPAAIERLDVLRVPEGHRTPEAEFSLKWNPPAPFKDLMVRIGKRAFILPARARNPLRRSEIHVLSQALIDLDREWIAAGLYARWSDWTDARWDGGVYLLVFHRRSRIEDVLLDGYVLETPSHHPHVEPCDGLVLFPERTPWGVQLSAVGVPGLRRLVMVNMVGDLLTISRLHAAGLRGEVLAVLADGAWHLISLSESTPRRIAQAPLPPLPDGAIVRVSPTLEWAVAVCLDGTIRTLTAPPLSAPRRHVARRKSER